jgi:hypothetical protein
MIYASVLIYTKYKLLDALKYILLVYKTSLPKQSAVKIVRIFSPVTKSNPIIKLW